MTRVRDLAEFAYYFFRPRAIRALWRLGSSFECVCWQHTYWQIECASERERRIAFMKGLQDGVGELQDLISKCR